MGPSIPRLNPSSFVCAVPRLNRDEEKGAKGLSATISIMMDDRPMEVREGTTVAAAILQAGLPSRSSVLGEPRQPLCGMGICYECRATVDGQPHQRTCQMVCRPGMQVVSG
jgi:D-hydroxyproline dehydrogenase subunit gamma